MRVCRSIWDPFTEPGVSATDTVDGEVAVTTSGTVNTSIAGSYIDLHRKGRSRNAATPVSRLVTVVDTDTTAPVITLLGDEDVSTRWVRIMRMRARQRGC